MAGQTNVFWTTSLSPVAEGKGMVQKMTPLLELEQAWDDQARGGLGGKEAKGQGSCHLPQPSGQSDRCQALVGSISGRGLHPASLRRTKIEPQDWT